MVGSGQIDHALMLDWREGRLDAATALSGLQPMLARLSGWAADKYGLTDQREDIRQELAMALLGDAGKKWRPDLSISSYMAGWAWRIASGIKQATERESLFDDPYASTEAATIEEVQVESDEPARLAELESQQAFAAQAYQRLLSSAVETASWEAEIKDLNSALGRSSRGVSKPRSPNSPHRLLKANERLFSLRKAVGLTRLDMAAALGIPLGRYAGYESGKIQTVPPQIYERAELLLANASARVKISEEIAELPMSAIVDRWCELLERPPLEVAKMIGVSRRTMQRWLSDIYRPRQNIVVYHYMKIQEMIRVHCNDRR